MHIIGGYLPSQSCVGGDEVNTFTRAVESGAINGIMPINLVMLYDIISSTTVIPRIFPAYARPLEVIS